MICKYCSAAADLRRIEREMKEETTSHLEHVLSGLISHFAKYCKGDNWCDNQKRIDVETV